MRDTLRNLTVSRVADGDPEGAMAWLERRTAWEARLRDLERDPGSAAGPGRESAGPVWADLGQPAGR